MSWISHKKTHLTPSHKPTFAPPLISVTEDTDLDFAVQKLIYVEDSVRKMIKEMRKYLIAIKNLDEADQRLTSNLVNSILVNVNSDFREIVEGYHSVTTHVGKSVQELSILCEKTFIEPLKKLREEFALIADELIKREQLVRSWKTCYQRLKKLEEKKDKTASHAVKLEKERELEASAAKKLKTYHSGLLAELQTFLNKRIDYIKPSVQALIMTQLDHYGKMNSNFTQLLPTNPVTRGNISDEDFDKLISTEINKIKSLQIVKK